MAFSDENTIDTASAISGFADVLDQAADEISSPREGGSPNVTAGDAVSLGGGAGFDPSAGVPGGPESQPFSGDSGGGIGEIEGTIDQEVDATNLGDKPSLQALQTAIESGGSPVDATMGDKTGGPADMIAGLMGEEEVAEEVAPGQQAADFLSDFNQGMSGVGHPDWGMSGSAVPMGAEQAAATASGGGQGWNNPNTVEGQLALAKAELKEVSNIASGVRTVQKGYPQPSLDINDYRVRDPSMITAEQAAVDASGGGQGWVDPNASFEDLEAQFSTSPHRMTAEQAALTASGDPTRGSDIRRQEELGITRSGGQGWVDPNTPQPVTDFITDVSMDPQYQPQRDLRELISLEESEATALAPKYSEETTGYQTHNEMYPNHRNVAAMSGVASIKSMFDGTHKAWIESINKDMKDRDIVLDHAINGVRTGKHSSGNWKEYDALFTVGEDGVPRDSDGVAMPGTEKQAQSGMAGALQGLWGGILSGAEKLFKPSTSSGVEEGAVKTNLPDLSFLPSNFEDITPEQMAEMEKRATDWYNSQQPGERTEAGYLAALQGASAPLETGANTFGADYDRPEPTRVAGDDTRGDNPVDIIRSNYAWASSLPNNVLFNAARYPDYLRLLIEYDAAGKDLPLTVPTWILEGTARPAEDDEEQTSLFANHPAMQTQELTWAT